MDSLLELLKWQKLKINIVAYEDVYHNAIRKALKVNDEEYNKVSVVDYAKKLLLLPNHLTVPMKLHHLCPRRNHGR
jgi:hypothetical protein